MRLTSDAPVNRIRATIRAGRDEMRRTLLDWLPVDLTGLRNIHPDQMGKESGIGKMWIDMHALQVEAGIADAVTGKAEPRVIAIMRQIR
jgi:hypothetical protein